MTKVYLAGNIANLFYYTVTHWRKDATEKLEKYDYDVLDPMRGKEHLEGTIVGFQHNSTACTSSEIFNRDVQDVYDCDIVLAYLTGYSIGTSWELGYAYALGKYIMVVTTPELIEHPFLSESSDWIGEDLDAAIEYLGKVVNNFFLTN